MPLQTMKSTLQRRETRFKVVIPARFGSTRLPGKPLILIGGQPMILHVCDRAREAHAEEIIVATDDMRIHQTVSDYGFTAVLTRSNHQSGTERIAEVSESRGWEASIISSACATEGLIAMGSARAPASDMDKDTCLRLDGASLAYIGKCLAFSG